MNEDEYRELAMSDKALDIEHLEKLYVDGESDDLLNDQAIEIEKRLNDEQKNAHWNNNTGRMQEIADQRKVFEELVTRIRNGRHVHAWDRFDAYRRNIDLSNKWSF